MNHMDVIDAMETLGFECTYRSYKSPPGLPYTVIKETNDSDFKADNKNYQKIRNYDLEYYHEIKHPPSEDKIENKLDELGLSYNKLETEIESENLIQTIYEIQLI